MHTRLVGFAGRLVLRGGVAMHVGRYEIINIIGKGATGRVARAYDPLIGRTVAVKLLPEQFACGPAHDKFVQEARVVGQLSHPSIITLHDMGVDEPTKTPYLVMEFIEGQSLDQVIAKGYVPYPKACAWAGDIAVALAAVHRKGVLHGDVKPANIFVTQENRVKLADFGIARLQNRDAIGAPLLGTPAYWCPEQLLGKPQDARSDLFSLGVVLFEMVTGKRPFKGESPQELCTQILNAKIPRASHVNSTVPVPLDAIIEKCLAKEQAGRYSDGDDLANDLWPLARRKQAKPVVGGQLVGVGRGSYLRSSN